MTTLVGSLACASPRVVDRTDVAADSLTAVTDRYTAWFFAGEADSLWASLSDRGRRRWAAPDSVARFSRQVLAVLTGFEGVVRDSVVHTDTLVTVSRFGINPRDGATYFLRFRLTPDAYRISAIGAQDAGVEAETPYLNHRTRAALRLPFDGDWVVFWGGRTIAENYHAAYGSQRFALDLIPAADSAVFARVLRGESTTLDDFVCFGHPVLSPGAGTVVVAVDSIADHPAGTLPPHEGWGNRVVIDHGTGEYSLLEHLKQGSVTVGVGQRVKPGEVVGACGNSGRVTHPALHYDLLTGPVEGRGVWSLPAQFQDYTVRGEVVSRGELRRWQRVRHRAH